MDAACWIGEPTPKNNHPFAMAPNPQPSRSTQILKNSINSSIVIVLVVGSVLLACAGKDDTAAIRELIANGEALAEAHDISGLLDLTTDDVRAMPMDLDRRGIRGLLWRIFNYYGPMNIVYPRPDIEIQKNATDASASFPFLILKKERTLPGLEELRDDPKAWIEAIGETVDLYRFQLQLKRRDRKWLVNHVRLERFTGLGFE
jgi:hypothetical protein